MPALEGKEKLQDIFYEECGTATKKFDYINVGFNAQNKIEVNYGAGLGSKHKGKSPLVRHFKVGLDGDYCDDVSSNKDDSFK